MVSAGNLIVSVSAKDKATGKEQKIAITNSSGLTKEEVERMVEDAKLHEDEDKKAFAERVVEEDLFYPVVLVNGEIVGEGNPRLKDVYEEIEKYL